MHVFAQCLIIMCGVGLQDERSYLSIPSFTSDSGQLVMTNVTLRCNTNLTQSAINFSVSTAPDLMSALGTLQEMGEDARLPASIRILRNMTLQVRCREVAGHKRCMMPLGPLGGDACETEASRRRYSGEKEGRQGSNQAHCDPAHKPRMTHAAPAPAPAPPSPWR